MHLVATVFRQQTLLIRARRESVWREEAPDTKLGYTDTSALDTRARPGHWLLTALVTGHSPDGLRSRGLAPVSRAPVSVSLLSLHSGSWRAFSRPASLPSLHVAELYTWFSPSAWQQRGNHPQMQFPAECLIGMSDVMSCLTKGKGLSRCGFGFSPRKNSGYF